MAACRFNEILSGRASEKNNETTTPTVHTVDEALGHLEQYSTPTLPHLLALLLYPEPTFPPKKTSLIVVDSLSTVFSTAFPRSIEEPPQGRRASSKVTPQEKQKNDAVQWAAGRRWAVMGDFILKLGKLAALKHLAILLTNQTVTKVKPETGAVLLPAISSALWEAGTANRLVLFRDFVSPGTETSEMSREVASRVRFAGVLKAGGAIKAESPPVPFVIKPVSNCKQHAIVSS